MLDSNLDGGFHRCRKLKNEVGAENLYYKVAEEEFLRKQKLRL